MSIGSEAKQNADYELANLRTKGLNHSAMIIDDYIKELEQALIEVAKRPVSIIVRQETGPSDDFVY